MKSELEKLNNVYVINTFDDFFDNDGNIRRDLFLRDELHLKPEVYRTWATKLEALW